MSWKELLEELLDSGYVQTDSDLLDFADENGCGYKEVTDYANELRMKGTQCEGCANVSAYPNNYPCTICVKRPGLFDMYKKPEEKQTNSICQTAYDREKEL